MRKSPSTINQRIPELLANANGLSLFVVFLKEERPPRDAARLRLKIDEIGDADLALLPVGVLFESGPWLVTGEIDVGWLEGSAGHATDQIGQLVVEKSRYVVVVRDVPAFHLMVTKHQVPLLN
jgi:hypothetical protein